MSDENAVKLNLLVAYPYLKPDVIKLIAEHQATTRFVLDSGAFTAWKLGKPIALDDYCRFIETLPIKPWRYFVLDVIGDPAATLRNYETMLARGFKPVPIFTRGEDPAALEDYYKTSDLVGVGGLVGTSGNKGYVNGIMKRIGSRRVHLLGFVDLVYLKVYRPYMCDSSAWEEAARFGKARIYLGNGQSVGVSRRGFAAQPSPVILERLRRLGFPASALQRTENWQGGNGLGRSLSATSAVAFSVDAQKNIGTKVFCAAAAGQAVDMLIQAFKRYQRS